MNKKKRGIGVLLLVVATLISTVIAFKIGINPPITNIFGAFGAIIFLIVVAKILKIDDGLFYLGLLFIFIASPMGSIINLYRTFDPYDKIVHFISGCLLAAFGMFIIEFLLKKFSNVTDLSSFFIPMIFAAFMFSSACAGIWEIFEFTADNIAGGGMQRGMVDTVTDMIAGNIGAIIYISVVAIKEKLKNSNK